MTFLDDYQVPYKFLGVRLVSDMLTRAPPDLLLRTGVDELMFTVRSIIAMLSTSRTSLKSYLVPRTFFITPRGSVDARLYTTSC